MRDTWVGAVLVATVLGGCGGSGVVDDAGGSQPQADAGALDASFDDDGGTWAVNWSSSSPFPQPVDHHGSLIVHLDAGPVLYVMGGLQHAVASDGGQEISFQTSIVGARVLADGGLGPFTTVSMLGKPLYYHTEVVVAGVDLFVVGGVTANDVGTLVPHTYADRFTVMENGLLVAGGAARLPVAIYNASAAVVRGRLVVVGGWDAARVPRADVWAAPLSAIPADPLAAPTSPFVAQAPLPQPRAYHSLVEHGGFLYVVGGLTTGGQFPGAVLRSRHRTSGEIEGWDEVAVLEDAAFGASAFVHGGGLWVLGGVSTQYHSRVLRAPLQDGGVGRFVEVKQALPVGRGYVRQTPVHQNRVYSVGGLVQDNDARFVSMNRVDIGLLERR